MVKKKNWKGQGLLQKIFSFLLVFALISESSAQASYRQDTLYLFLNQITPVLKNYFGEKNFSILNNANGENVRLKKYLSTTVHQILSSRLEDLEIDSFINYKGESFVFNEAEMMISTISSELFNNEANYRRVKGNNRIDINKISFPILGITKPYFFSNYRFCIVGINYYSSFDTGSFGYYFFEKECGNWKLAKVVFEGMK